MQSLGIPIFLLMECGSLDSSSFVKVPYMSQEVDWLRHVGLPYESLRGKKQTLP